jgi:hypothetical protein
VLGQRALGAPTILVTNQYTLWDGENFTEGYRVMKRGKVVGEPTAGWDVYGTMILARGISPHEVPQRKESVAKVSGVTITYRCPQRRRPEPPNARIRHRRLITRHVY